MVDDVVDDAARSVPSTVQAGGNRGSVRKVLSSCVENASQVACCKHIQEMQAEDEVLL